MKVGFLGRFQPFHRGHKQVVEEYRDRFDEFKILVGSADKQREGKNPLSFDERREVIHECFPDIKVISLEDTEKTEEGNKEWAAKLEEKDIDAVISQNELVQRLVKEHTSLELLEQELYDPEIYSGTETRRRIRSGEEWRYLVPDCATKRIEQLIEVIRKSGIQYEFKPGWKKENAYHGTADG